MACRAPDFAVAPEQLSNYKALRFCFCLAKAMKNKTTHSRFSKCFTNTNIARKTAQEPKIRR